MPASALGDPRCSIDGYQFDFNFSGTYPGQLTEGFGGGIIAARGQIVHAETGKPLRVIGSLGSNEALGGYWKQNDWNEVHLVACGNVLTRILNGHVMAILIDDETMKAKAKGLIGLQTAGSGTEKVRSATSGFETNGGGGESSHILYNLVSSHLLLIRRAEDP